MKPGVQARVRLCSLPDVLLERITQLLPTGRDATALASTNKRLRLLVGADKERLRTAERWAAVYAAHRRPFREQLMRDMRDSLAEHYMYGFADESVCQRSADVAMQTFSFTPECRAQDILDAATPTAAIIAMVYQYADDFEPGPSMGRISEVFAGCYNRRLVQSARYSAFEVAGKLIDAIGEDVCETDPSIWRGKELRDFYELAADWYLNDRSDLAAAWAGVAGRYNIAIEP